MTHSSTWLWKPQETYNHGRKGSRHILHDSRWGVYEGSSHKISCFYKGESLQILWELIHCHRNSRGKLPPWLIQSSPTRSLSQHLGNTIQDEIWMGTEPDHMTAHYKKHSVFILLKISPTSHSLIEFLPQPQQKTLFKFEPRRQRLWWARNAPLHSCLGNNSETPSQKQNKTKKQISQELTHYC